MRKFLIIIALLITTILPASVLADSSVKFEPAVSIPGSQFQAKRSITVKNDTSTLCDYIIAYYKYGMAVIGIIAIVIIAVGGLMWVMSAGNSGNIGKAQGYIKDALLGVGLLLFSFLILATINKDLVVCKKTTITDVPNKAVDIKIAPTCHFEIKNKNATPACDDGFIQDADENKCRFKDGTPNGDYDPNNRNGMVNNCCCPNPDRLSNAAFCNSQEEGTTCMVNGGWGYCETQSNNNKICRSCKVIRTQEVTKENIDNTPERERCYRNGENWECQNSLGWCGNKAVGSDCNMEYVYKNPVNGVVFGLLTSGNPLLYSAYKSTSWFLESVGTGVLSCWGNGNVIAACFCR